MSEEKWTEGDWSVRDCPMKGAHTDAKDDGRIKLIDYNDGEYEGTLAIVKTECSQANADLLSAAPKLYSALKDAMRSARKDFPSGEEGERMFYEAYEEQMGALSKARGES